jgi:release factor glutamine methyltransferase
MTSPTVRSLLDAAARRLRNAGVPSPRLDVALLLAHVLGVERHVLSMDPDRTVTDEDAGAFDDLVAQREQRCPVSHLVGEVEFWSLAFRVTDATLAPRPETEMLVERAVAFLRGVEQPLVVEVGTGTGCIAVAIAHEVPAAQVHTVDVSADALSAAGENAARHGVGDRIHLHHGDTVAPLAGVVAEGSVDVLVSNPPYVRHEERDTVDPEVLWEPESAIFCDGDPVDVYATIARDGAPYVRTGGLLLLELPGDDPAPIAAAVEATGAWQDVVVEPDLAGHPRVLRATRR